VFQDSRISVLACTEVASYEGYVGNFTLTLRTTPPEDAGDLSAANSYSPFSGYRPSCPQGDQSEKIIQTGAVVMATGFRPYAPAHGEYGYLTWPEVMTLPEFLEETAKNPSKSEMLSIKGRKIKRLAFIHCVGSRQIPGIHEPAADGKYNEYCSRTCCSAILRTAVEIRETYPQTRVLDFYRDIRTYGRDQEAYYEKASENNVLFFRFEPDGPPLVEASSGGPYPLRIRVKDTLTFGEELEAEVDLVVLAVGM
jgi:heterodisulfide reductase subunit A